jgi:hypothetical protein
VGPSLQLIGQFTTSSPPGVREEKNTLKRAASYRDLDEEGIPPVPASTWDQSLATAWIYWDLLPYRFPHDTIEVSITIYLGVECSRRARLCRQQEAIDMAGEACLLLRHPLLVASLVR